MLKIWILAGFVSLVVAVKFAQEQKERRLKRVKAGLPSTDFLGTKGLREVNTIGTFIFIMLSIIYFQDQLNFFNSLMETISLHSGWKFSYRKTDIPILIILSMILFYPLLFMYKKISINTHKKIGWALLLSIVLLFVLVLRGLNG